jgi:hypothetical protein
MEIELDHQDVLDRPWLYNPRIYHLVASLALAQETIDQMRVDLATADEEIGRLQDEKEDAEERDWEDRMGDNS